MIISAHLEIYSVAAKILLYPLTVPASTRAMISIPKLRMDRNVLLDIKYLIVGVYISLVLTYLASQAKSIQPVFIVGQ